MRANSITGLVVAALVAAGCISVVSPPTPPPATPTSAPTEAPTAPPTAPPTSPPTGAPTAAPTETPTLAPGQTPLPTPLDIRPFLTAGVTVYNLGDSTLYVTASAIDPDTGDATTLGAYTIEPEQFTRQAAVPLRLRFDFSFDQAVLDALGSCTMTVADADEVDFVAVAEGVTVTKNGVEPDTLAEMVVPTSSLCSAGATQ